MMILAAKVLRKYGRLAPARLILDLAMKLAPGSVAVFAEFCVNRMAARDFSAITERCKAVARMTTVSDALKEAASSFLTRASLDDDASVETMALLRNGFRSASARSAEQFRLGQYAASRVAFAQALALSGAPEKAVPEWLAAFDAIAGSDAGDTESAGAPLVADAVLPVRKIVVSGMYWSGSGAIYDYLREFGQLAPVTGELRLWKEDGLCLNDLAHGFGDARRFNDDLFRFLALALAGNSPVANWREQLAVQYALATVRSDIYGRYARACRSFVEEAVALARNRDSPHDSFIDTAARFSDRLARYWAGNDADLVLFDNIVHIGGIDAVSLLGDAVVLCSFRDPRSNFVARWYENPRFHRDVGRYIEYYRDTMERFETALAGSAELASRVRRIRFEDFILSETYRDELAVSCGLDLGRRDKGRYFKPRASHRNVANYIDFPHQDSIRLIERELGAYCVEPTTASEHVHG
ncbi:MAG: hypothetical protein A2Y38_00215 [Spirochaetes bacterium GWB1_59_5]|nr:MAG: hypothetical protein A2Y38_00215 [Spirochaetes bacterium GWB1_59_5]